MNHNILFLYAELMPYNIPVLKELVKLGYQIHIIKWDQKKLTPYQAPNLEGVTYYEHSQFNKGNLIDFIFELSPRLIYVSGWMDSLYNVVLRSIKKRIAVPIIAGSDTQWQGRRQWANVILSKLGRMRRFSHILIAGTRQYHYAKKLGFSDKQILMHVCSADVESFNRVSITSKEKKYPRKVLFIGRLAKEKGVIQLIESWKNLKQYNGWSLKIIGSGPLLTEIENLIEDSNIELSGFMSQQAIVKEMNEAGFFVLPSVFEPWALVIHEAACGGLPILCTDVCGASDHFVINGYNGFVISPSQIELSKALEKVTTLTTDKLLEFSNRSRMLSNRITPEIVAHTILSTIR